MAAPVDDESALPKIPDLRVSHLVYLLTQNDAVAPNKAALKAELLGKMKEYSMAGYYETVAPQLGWPVDAAFLGELRANFAAKEQQLEAAITDAVTNQGESEIREAHLAKANFYAAAALKDRAIAALRVTEEKTVAVGQKTDIMFELLRLGFFFRDDDLINRTLERAKTLVEQGGDWDRRNRLKVYQALQFLRVRNFQRAAELFLETLSTFTSSELCSYSQFVFYAVMTSLLALHRVQLKAKVLHAPEILAVIDDTLHLRDLLQSLYNSNFATFFQALAPLQGRLRADEYFAPHARFYVREMRIKAYAQLLESYRSVQIDSLAAAFGVSRDFVDRELSRFIASGRLHCKIDKVAGIVETTRPDSKNHLYQTTIRDGDLLLNRIQKLSRVINL